MPFSCECPSNDCEYRVVVSGDSEWLKLDSKMPVEKRLGDNTLQIHKKCYNPHTMKILFESETMYIVDWNGKYSHQSLMEKLKEWWYTLFS